MNAIKIGFKQMTLFYSSKGNFPKNSPYFLNLTKKQYKSDADINGNINCSEESKNEKS